jgi:hypothetical protein
MGLCISSVFLVSGLSFVSIAHSDHVCIGIFYANIWAKSGKFVFLRFLSAVALSTVLPCQLVVFIMHQDSISFLALFSCNLSTLYIHLLLPRCKLLNNSVSNSASSLCYSWCYLWVHTTFRQLATTSSTRQVLIVARRRSDECRSGCVCFLIYRSFFYE